MQIQKCKTYTLLTVRKKTIQEVIKAILSNKDLNNEHLIVNYSQKNKLSIKELLLHLHLAEEKKKHGTSFVVVYSKADVDKIPETLNIVPTIEEALDILEMETIERDLGF